MIKKPYWVNATELTSMQNWVIENLCLTGSNQGFGWVAGHDHKL